MAAVFGGIVDPGSDRLLLGLTKWRGSSPGLLVFLTTAILDGRQMLSLGFLHMPPPL